MSATYLLKYRSKQGRVYETEIDGRNYGGVKLHALARSTANEEIKLHHPGDSVASIAINFAGHGDAARLTLSPPKRGRGNPL